MSLMIQCNFMIALPKGAPLVHHPMEAIQPAHHRMASTLLVHLPTEAIHPAHHRMASTPLVHCSMKTIHQLHHCMTSTPLVLHPVEAIHPAHHCMTSTPLVLLPAEAMQLTWHRTGEMQAAHLMRATSMDSRQTMRGRHVMDVRGRSKKSFTKREGSMKSSRE